MCHILHPRTNVRGFKPQRVEFANDMIAEIKNGPGSKLRDNGQLGLASELLSCNR